MLPRLRDTSDCDDDEHESGMRKRASLVTARGSDIAARRRLRRSDLARLKCFSIPYDVTGN
jgi:hypothetical protein